MADIKFYCPNCGGKLGIDEKAAGLLIDCPLCGKEIDIPRQSTPPRPPQPAPPPPPPPPAPLPRTGTMRVSPPPKMDLSAVTQPIPMPVPLTPPAAVAAPPPPVKLSPPPKLDLSAVTQAIPTPTLLRPPPEPIPTPEKSPALDTVRTALQARIAQLEDLQKAAGQNEAELRGWAEKAEARAKQEEDRAAAALSRAGELEKQLQRLAPLAVRVEQLLKQVGDLAESQAALQRELKSQTSAKQLLAAQMAELEAGLKRASEAEARALQDAVSLKQQVADLQASAAAAARKAGEAQQAAAAHAEALEAGKASAAQELSQLRAQLAAVEAERDQLAKDLAASRGSDGDPESARNIILGLQESVEEFRTKLAESEVRQSQAEREVQRLKDQAAQGQQLIKQAEAKANVVREENLKLVQERDQLRKETEELRARVLDGEKRDRNTQALADRITKLQAQITRLQGEESKLASVIREAEHKTARAEPPPAASAAAPAPPAAPAAVTPKARPVASARAPKRLIVLVGSGCFLLGLLAMFFIVRAPDHRGADAAKLAGESEDAVAGAASQGERLEAVPVGTPTVVDDVEIVVDKVELRRVTKIDPLGNKSLSDQPFLVVNVSLRNQLADRSVYLLHTWEQAKLIDEKQNSARPVFPGRFSLDQVEGLQTKGDMAPGERLQDIIVFDAPAEGATTFTLLSDPGFWKKTERGNFIPVSRATFRVAFGADQFVITDEPPVAPHQAEPPQPESPSS